MRSTVPFSAPAATCPPLAANILVPHTREYRCRVDLTHWGELPKLRWGKPYFLGDACNASRRPGSQAGRLGWPGTAAQAGCARYGVSPTSAMYRAFWLPGRRAAVRPLAGLTNAPAPAMRMAGILQAWEGGLKLPGAA